MSTLISLLLLPLTAFADLWVDHGLGDDDNPGSKTAPLATIDEALNRVSPGQTIHLIPGTKPWPGDVRIEKDGTREKPITLDGHGAVLSGKRVLPADAWTKEQIRDRAVYSRPLPNNAWGMYSHWEGDFPLVWFDGKPGVNVTRDEDLRPGTYFLYKNRTEAKSDPHHNTLYICLPQNVTLAQVESIAGESGIFVGGDHVIVKNVVTEYGGRDGFATHRNTGVVFENVEARYFMDQGISNHGAAEVIVRDSHFHHNAGCGIVDVYPECRVLYENCLIEHNTWRGGVEFHKGVFEMHRCTIRSNGHKAVTVTKGARVRLIDCQLAATPSDPGLGVRLSPDSRLELVGCEIEGFETGLSAAIRSPDDLKLKNCTFTNCETPKKVTRK